MSDKSGVCAIVPLDQDDFSPYVIGMGILLDDREVVTCAHVIDEALGKGWHMGPSTPRVRVCFPFADGDSCLDGTVDKSRLSLPGPTRRGEPSDIAFIQLDQSAPASAERAVLSNHVRGQSAGAFGFRGAESSEGGVSHPTGEWVAGTIMGSLPGGRAQFDGVNALGAAIERGYSGAGIYVQTSDNVVGMIVEKDKVQKIAQFIDVPSLNKARVRVAAPARAARSAAPPSLIAKTQKKIAEIEKYLRTIGASLPPPNPDAGLLPFLEPILDGDDENARTLRVAFGLPEKVQDSRNIYALVVSSEPSMQPLLGILAQRLNHLLWRFKATLEFISAEWATEFMTRSEALQAICEPHLVAKQPTLRDVSAALRLARDLRAFTESAPDPTLYAVLRSFPETNDSLPPEEGQESAGDRNVALNFLYDYLAQLLSGQRQIDDSSNAWWAVRTGIWERDVRFRGLLNGVAKKYYDITVPHEEVSRLSAVPEIYKSIRTSSYTLSNAQAIVERDRALDDPLKDRLRQVIYRMLERLLKTPLSKQLYLASVHHEGLRNYLDYVRDQEQEGISKDSANPAERTKRE